MGCDKKTMNRRGRVWAQYQRRSLQRLRYLNTKSNFDPKLNPGPNTNTNSLLLDHIPLQEISHLRQCLAWTKPFSTVRLPGGPKC